MEMPEQYGEIVNEMVNILLTVVSVLYKMVVIVNERGSLKPLLNLEMLAEYEKSMAIVQRFSTIPQEDRSLVVERAVKLMAEKMEALNIPQEMKAYFLGAALK